MGLLSGGGFHLAATSLKTAAVTTAAAGAGFAGTVVPITTYQHAQALNEHTQQLVVDNHINDKSSMPDIAKTIIAEAVQQAKPKQKPEVTIKKPVLPTEHTVAEVKNVPAEVVGSLKPKAQRMKANTLRNLTSHTNSNIEDTISTAEKNLSQKGSNSSNSTNPINGANDVANEENGSSSTPTNPPADKPTVPPNVPDTYVRNPVNKIVTLVFHVKTEKGQTLSNKGVQVTVTGTQTIKNGDISTAVTSWDNLDNIKSYFTTADLTGYTLDDSKLPANQAISDVSDIYTYDIIATPNSSTNPPDNGSGNDNNGNNSGNTDNNGNNSGDNGDSSNVTPPPADTTVSKTFTWVQQYVNAQGAVIASQHTQSITVNGTKNGTTGEVKWEKNSVAFSTVSLPNVSGYVTPQAPAAPNVNVANGSTSTTTQVVYQAQPVTPPDSQSSSWSVGKIQQNVTLVQNAAKATIAGLPASPTDPSYNNTISTASITESNYQNQSAAAVSALQKANFGILFTPQQLQQDLNLLTQWNQRYNARILQDVNTFRGKLDIAPMSSLNTTQAQSYAGTASIRSFANGYNHLTSSQDNQVGMANMFGENLYMGMLSSSSNISPEAVADQSIIAYLNEYQNFGTANTVGHLTNLLTNRATLGSMYISKATSVSAGFFGKINQFTYYSAMNFQ